jgi:hypothetical protein
MPHRLKLIVPQEPGAFHALADLMAKVPNFGDLADIQYTGGEPAPVVTVNGIEPRFRRVKWAKHQNKRTRKKWWTAKVGPHALRVEWGKTKEAGVFFDGYIDDAFQHRGKQLEAVRDRIATAARSRTPIAA